MNRSTYSEPVARRTDPHTSHEAAASVTDLRPRQQAVLDTLAQYPGGLTDVALLRLYSGPEQSESGIRTRRHELVALGLVVDTGERRTLPTGRTAIVWAVAP